MHKKVVLIKQGGLCKQGSYNAGSTVHCIFFLNILFCVAGMDEDIRLAMQDQLVDVIMWVLVTHSELHYYQVSRTFAVKIDPG